MKEDTKERVLARVVASDLSQIYGGPDNEGGNATGGTTTSYTTCYSSGSNPCSVSGSDSDSDTD